MAMTMERAIEIGELMIKKHLALADMCKTTPIKRDHAKDAEAISMLIGFYERVTDFIATEMEAAS